MIVAELIKSLERFCGSSEVKMTYEGVVDPLENSEIFLSHDGVVLIGGEYKEDFLSGKRNGRYE